MTTLKCLTGVTLSGAVSFTGVLQYLTNAWTKMTDLLYLLEPSDVAMTD